MGLDVYLLAVPKEVESILKKVEQKQASEYCDAVFSLPRAFENDFVDFGHPDWIAFKKDAQDLVQYYPKNKFDSKFYMDTNRTYGIFDYLLAKRENSVRHFKDATPFFYDGIKHNTCESGQGFKLIYWDLEILQKKKELFDAISFEELYELYDFKNMVAECVYKIEQLNQATEELQDMFNKIKTFLENAIELQGYVLVFK